MLATDVVLAALDEPLFDEIDRAAEHGLKLFFHAHEVIESPGSIWREGYQHVDIRALAPLFRWPTLGDIIADYA
jgi:hypothetical protein